MLARGGMLTKVLAAKRAARSGASTVIADGREERVLTRLAAGEAIGTQLVAEAMSLAARKQWLADHVRTAGRLMLDAGAARALIRDGKSLLPIGVVACDGAFERGEVVGCFDPEGREIARGLVNYSASETLRILRKPSVGDRGHPRLRRRARAHPPQQPGPALRRTLARVRRGGTEYGDGIDRLGVRPRRRDDPGASAGVDADNARARSGRADRRRA